MQSRLLERNLPSRGFAVFGEAIGLFFVERDSTNGARHMESEREPHRRRYETTSPSVLSSGVPTASFELQKFDAEPQRIGAFCPDHSASQSSLSRGLLASLHLRGQ